MVFANVWQKAAGWSAEEEFTRIRIFSADGITQKSNDSKRWRRERLKEPHNIYIKRILESKEDDRIRMKQEEFRQNYYQNDAHLFSILTMCQLSHFF